MATAVVTEAQPFTHRGKPGAVGFVKGCDCRVCTAAYEETVDMRVALTGGVTVSEVGRTFGVTRQAVQFRIRRVYGRGWLASTRPPRPSRFERLPGNDWYRQHIKVCVVCAVPYLPGGSGGTPRACSDPACQHAWLNGLARHCVPGRRSAHARSVARWTLAHPDSVPDFQVRTGIRVLSGQTARYEGVWATRPRSWLTVGSVTWRAARRAWVRGGQAADMLPAEVADRAFVDLRAAPVGDRWTLAHKETP